MPDPIYRYTAKEAGCNNELELWRASYRSNIACKKSIEKALSEKFDGMHLQSDTAETLCQEYGMDRIGLVLSETVKMLEYDGRFRPENKEWAKNQNILCGDDPDHTRDYVVNSHPELVNGLINQYRRYIDGLHLLGSNSCIDSDKPLDFSGKLLILNPAHLKDEYRTPEYQLFYAETGFGCDPAAIGRKVFGFFLKDDERTHFDRSDFIGVADEEKLPDWAKQKLGDIRSGQE